MVGFTTEVVVVLWLELVMGMVKKELQRVHELSPRDNYVSLYRRLQRRGYYWPEMAKGVVMLQQLARNARNP